MRRPVLTDLQVALREISAELRSTPCPLSRLALKAERADVERRIAAERDRQAA